MSSDRTLINFRVPDELIEVFDESCDFKNVKLWDWREVEHSNFDDYSQAYIPHMDKENGTLISLNIECTK